VHTPKPSAGSGSKASQLHAANRGVRKTASSPLRDRLVHGPAGQETDPAGRCAICRRVQNCAGETGGAESRVQGTLGLETQRRPGIRPGCGLARRVRAVGRVRSFCPDEAPRGHGAG